MKKSTSSKVAGYLFALLMFGLSITMFRLAFVWWGRNTSIAAATACTGTLMLVAAFFHLWIWRKTARLWAYTNRLRWETDRIYKGSGGETASCDTCKRNLPVLAFEVGENRSLTCALCSPEAKSAGEGTYAVSKTQSSLER